MYNDILRTPRIPALDAEPAADGAAEPDRAALSRALRDLEAAKFRVARDAKSAQDEMRQQLVLEILPVLDNLDRTIKAAEDSGDAPSVVEGVYLVRGQLEGVLRSYGVERVDAINKRFDPKLHEAISTMAVTDPASNGLILDQLEPGYRFGEKLLRPARVVVAKLTPLRAQAPVRWH